MKTKGASPTVAVLGAGIMGSSIALLLARRNIRSVLIDAAPSPFTGASRWNEGKIHLGYLYLGDPTLATARKLIPGGLSFPALVGEITGQALQADEITPHNDTYLIHKASVVGAERAYETAKKVSDLTLEHPDAGSYFVSLDANRPRQLTRKELEQRYDLSEIDAGFEVPERSVQTTRIADRYVNALDQCEPIEQLMDNRVRSVRKNGQRWQVEVQSSDGKTAWLGPFDAVVNALWEGRALIDAGLGIRHSAEWTHRYRLSLFARTGMPIDLNSTVIALGPFGDVKNYNGTTFYLSWYEAGLLATGHDLAPPTILEPDDSERIAIVAAKLDNLARFIPEIRKLRLNMKSFELRGGWVYAAGQGALNDPHSGLHRRDQIGLVEKQGYFSIDTGKYSIAPWIATQVTDMLAACLPG